MPGSKSLLRGVLNKNSVKMEAKGRISVIVGLAKEYYRLVPESNESEMEKFLSFLHQAHGGEIKPMQFIMSMPTEDNSIEQLRYLLEVSIENFLAYIQTASPQIFLSMNSMDWRYLFGIPPVHVTVKPPSDEDSGGGGSADSR